MSKDFKDFSFLHPRTPSLLFNDPVWTYDPDSVPTSAEADAEFNRHLAMARTSQNVQAQPQAAAPAPTAPQPVEFRGQQTQIGYSGERNELQPGDGGVFEPRNDNPFIRMNGSLGLNYNHGFEQSIVPEYNTKPGTQWFHDYTDAMALVENSPHQGRDSNTGLHQEEGTFNGPINMASTGDSFVQCSYGHRYDVNTGYCPMCWEQQQAVETRASLATLAQLGYGNGNGQSRPPPPPALGVPMRDGNGNGSGIQNGSGVSIQSGNGTSVLARQLSELLEAAVRLNSKSAAAKDLNHNAFAAFHAQAVDVAVPARSMFENGNHGNDRNLGFGSVEAEHSYAHDSAFAPNGPQNDQHFGAAQNMKGAEGARDNQYAAALMARLPLFNNRRRHAPISVGTGARVQVPAQGQAIPMRNGGPQQTNNLAFHKGPAGNMQDLEALYEARIRDAVSTGPKLTPLEEKFMVLCRRAQHHYEFKFYPNCLMCAHDDFFMK